MATQVPFKKMPPNEVNGPESWSFDVENNDPRKDATCSRIFDFLFIGGRLAAENSAWLKQMNITCVINVRTEAIKNICDGIEYMDVDVEDEEYEPIHWHFDDTSAKIEAHRVAKGRVLINCEMGISRSATICLMYMVRWQNRSLREAYYELKGLRPCIYPNMYFWHNMVKFEKKWRSKATVALRDVGYLRPVPDVYLPK